MKETDKEMEKVIQKERERTKVREKQIDKEKE